MLTNLVFEGQRIRVFGTAEKPEWVAADVCKILGIGNPSKALLKFDDDEKGITSSNTPGGVQDLLTVTEPGLYRLIFKSRKPIAKQFQRWVYHDVLPCIRMYGQYPSLNLRGTATIAIGLVARGIGAAHRKGRSLEGR